MANNNALNKDQLKQLKIIELEILDVFVKFCDKYELTYYLTGGTLLGLIKYKGFIPWDDDIDVAMFRKDYELFINKWIEEGNDKYFLDCYKTNPQCILPFSKLRKNGTFISEFENIDKDAHNGISIDIFPLDNANKYLGFREKMTKRVSEAFRRAIFYKKGYSKDKMLIVRILSVFSIKFLCKIQQIINKMNKNEDSLYCINYAGAYSATKETHLKSDYVPATKGLFENKEYSIPKNSDIVMKRVYGENYKEYEPPMEKRVVHGIVEISFGEDNK